MEPASWWPEDHVMRADAYFKAVERNMVLSDGLRLNECQVIVQHAPEARFANGGILLSPTNVLSGLNTIRLGYGTILKVGSLVQERLGLEAGQEVVYSSFMGLRFFGQRQPFYRRGWHEHESDEHRLFKVFYPNKKGGYDYPSDILGLWESDEGKSVIYRDEAAVVQRDHYLDGDYLKLSVRDNEQWCNRSEVKGLGR